MMLYWDAYFADTMDLTAAEHGSYLCLLGFMWINKGTLPDDDAKIARMLRVRPTSWKKTKATLARFFIFANGEISQKKLTKTWKKANEISATRALVGELGVEAKRRAKALNLQNVVPANGQAIASANAILDAAAIGSAKRNHLNLNLKEEDSSPPNPPPENADPPPKKEEAGEPGVFLLRSIRVICDLPAALPATGFWSAARALPYVREWQAQLSDERILQVAREWRAEHPEPPNGPLAFNLRMQAAGAAASEGEDAPETREARWTAALTYLASEINGGGYCAQSMIKSSTRGELLHRGLVTEEKLRERGM